MIRALFISELKRTLPSNLLIGLAALFVLWVIGRVARRATDDLAQVDTLVTACAAGFALLSAFLFGAKAFGQLKDRHSSFLLTLPAQRVRSWATIVTANLAGAIAISGMIGILHFPSLQVDITASMVAAVLLFYFALFFLGCCAVLIFRRAVSVAVTGFLFTAGGLLFAVLLDAYLETSSPSFALAVQSFSVAVLAFGSMRAFGRGEFNDVRVQIRSLTTLAACILGFMAVLAAIIQAGVPTRWDAWSNDVFWATVSDDGSHMAILTRHRRYRIYTRADIVDVRSGAIQATFVGLGLRFPVWSADGEVVNFISNPGVSGALVRYSKNGRQLQQLRTPAFSPVELASRVGTDIWITGVHSTQSDLRFYLRTGDTSGTFERTDIQTTPRRLNLLHRLELALTRAPILSSPNELAQQLSAKFPPPAADSTGVVGAYWATDAFYHLTKTAPAYIRADKARSRGTIFVYRESGWKPILEDILLAEQTVRRIAGSRGIVEYQLLPDADMDAARRFIAYRKKEGDKFFLYVYDIANDKVTNLGEYDPGTPPGSVFIDVVPGRETRTIGFSNSVEFLFFPNDNSFRRVTSLRRPAFRIWIDDAGNQIIQDGPRDIAYLQHDGQRRRLWPVDAP